VTLAGLMNRRAPTRPETLEVAMICAAVIGFGTNAFCREPLTVDVAEILAVMTRRKTLTRPLTVDVALI
jgi:hypothetical protein